MRIKRNLTRLYGFRLVWTVVAVLSLLMFATIGQAQPSNFVNITNHEIRWSGTGNFDWANGPNSAGAITTSSAGVVNAPGTNGVFDGGVYNGLTTPPTPPNRTAASLADSAIVDADFLADPLSVDVTSCGTGDPSVYTGAGSEVNGELFSSMTWGTGSVPNKDDVANAYALARRTANDYEIFFGAERVINNGDSHIDFEFLQAKNIAKVGTCSGSFTGDRSQGDMLVAVDFTSGGTLGETKLYVWNCLAEGSTQPAIGTVCNPPLHGKSVPHYQQTASTFVVFGVNSAGDIQGGGWASRNADGTQTTTVATNEFMEGGIDLAELGFTGCVNTFLPHTRSSQSFTAVLKDFAGPIAFSSCRTPTVTTSLSGGGQTGASITVTVGTTVTDTATLTGVTAGAGGTLTYTVYSDVNCTQNAVNAGVVTVTNGSVPASNPITFNSAGTFYWQAVYSGDVQNGGANFGATSACTAEQLTVQKLSPTITTHLTGAGQSGASISVPLGAVVTDTATLTGATSNAGGTVTYTVYTNNTCTNVYAAAGSVSVTNGSVPASNQVSFPTAGTFYWQAVYSGDANNNGATSQCTAEVLTVRFPSTNLTISSEIDATWTHTYIETNDGQEALTNPTVVDDNCAPVNQVLNNSGKNVGDANGDGVLDPGESWVFSCSQPFNLRRTGSATQLNTATASGTDQIGQNVTFCPPGTQPANTVCDADERRLQSATITINPPQ
ncbi:MAG: Ig-like domain repeat protein [Chloroflexi bacterium]|nr:Ig-like domain repeat protein [Chloroflexota bacterium]